MNSIKQVNKSQSESNCSVATFAAYFQSDEIWYLHSWGIERRAVSEIADELLRDERCDAIKFEPTPPQLLEL